MKNQVTFSHVMAILSVIVIPLIIWGFFVETRFERVKTNTIGIINLKDDLEKKLVKDDKNFELILKHLHNIELQLKDKKDRE